jgi:serine/threonine protein kinase
MLCPPSESTPQHDPAVAQRRAPLEKVPTDEWTLSGQRIVLLDCGLNRLPATSDGAQTQWLGDRRRAGRSAYAPPELFGGGRETGPTTDVYALGATLYHMLTGEAPVEAPSRALGTVLQPPHRANVRINPALSEAVMWALELRSEHRPPTVEAFLNQLSQCGSEAPVRQARCRLHRQPVRHLKKSYPYHRLNRFLQRMALRPLPQDRLTLFKYQPFQPLIKRRVTLLSVSHPTVLHPMEAPRPQAR